MATASTPTPRSPTPSSTARAAALARQATLTKPTGALGRLEDLSVWLAGVQGTCPPAPFARPAVVILAGAGLAAFSAGARRFIGRRLGGRRAEPGRRRQRQLLLPPFRGRGLHLGLAAARELLVAARQLVYAGQLANAPDAEMFKKRLGGPVQERAPGQLAAPDNADKLALDQAAHDRIHAHAADRLDLRARNGLAVGYDGESLYRGP